jgi:hypothetical protein
MNETFKPEITELIIEPDNVEKIRDCIACIIKGETQNQYELAKNNAERNKEDYNFRVFINNARPYDTEGEPIETPIINIILQKTEPLDGNARAGQQKTKATFIIDCINFGNDGGEVWNEKVAAARAWKTARIIRRILMSDNYMYLGMRGIIGSRNILSAEAGIPDNGGDALTVVTVRITLAVQFIECVINSAGEIIEGIDFVIDPSNGEVFKK